MARCSFQPHNTFRTRSEGSMSVLRSIALFLLKGAKKALLRLNDGKSADGDGEGKQKESGERVALGPILSYRQEPGERVRPKRRSSATLADDVNRAKLLSEDLSNEEFIEWFTKETGMSFGDLREC